MLIDLKDRNRLFWMLHTSGWLFFLAIVLLINKIGGHLTRAVAAEASVSMAVGFMITLGLRFIYRKTGLQARSVLSLSLRAAAFSFLGANAGIWILTAINGSYAQVDIPASSPVVRYLASLSTYVAPFIGWNALYFGIKFWQDRIIQKERTERARALAQTAQLQMLRYRMNPHFLFNTLNSIRALISENKTSAKTMVTELSEYLRFALVSKNYENVPFRDEMESVRHYFNIQKMRYEDKMDVTFDIDPAADEYPIISFLLHPLAENAVKHGLSTSLLPLKIRIGAKLHQGALQIDIVNSGSWVEPERQDKDALIRTGLDNVRRRLADAYPEKHRLDIFEKEGAVHVRLTLGEGREERRTWFRQNREAG